MRESFRGISGKFSQERFAQRSDDDPIWQAKAFAVARLAPSDATATNIKDVLREYALWVPGRRHQALPVKSMATAIVSLFDVAKRGNDYLVTGVSLKALENLSGKQVEHASR